MTEFKLTIEAPALTEALKYLADALRQSFSGAQDVGGTIPFPALEKPPVAPVEAPVAVPDVPAEPAPVNPPETPAPAPAVTAAPSVEAPSPAPAPERKYTLKEISDAGSGLLDQGKMQDLMNLLDSFGVPAITMLKPDQYPAFVEGLKALGAKID